MHHSIRDLEQFLSLHFVQNEQVEEVETICHFQTKLCDVLIKNGLLDNEAFKSKRFSLSCKAELQLQQRGTRSTEHFSLFRNELLEQLCLNKKRHVLGAINEFQNKVLQLSDYFNNNRQDAERNFASLPEFNIRARQVASQLRNDLTKIKDDWKNALRPILVDLVETSWPKWSDVERISKSIGLERIKRSNNIRSIAPAIASDIYNAFTAVSHKKLKPAVEKLLGLMVNKFEENTQELKQPLLNHQASAFVETAIPKLKQK